ncbi:MAG: carboxymuconolactone decarboxylase family protein [Novosphingobium sp.]
MARLDLPEELDAEQRRVFDIITAGPRGKVEGPLRVWLHSPQLAEAAQALGAFCRFGSALEPRLSELAILVCGATWKSGFEWAVHAPIAIAQGLDADVVEAMRIGAPPKFERDDEALVHVFCTTLIETRQIDDALYQKATGLLGDRKVVDLVGIVGYYSFICMTINVFAVPLPDGTANPF